MPASLPKRTPAQLQQLQVHLIGQTLEHIQQQMEAYSLDISGLVDLTEALGRSLNTTIDLLELWEQSEPEAREDILDRILTDLRAVMPDADPPIACRPKESNASHPRVARRLARRARHHLQVHHPGHLLQLARQLLGFVLRYAKIDNLWHFPTSCCSHANTGFAQVEGGISLLSSPSGSCKPNCPMHHWKNDQFSRSKQPISSLFRIMNVRLHSSPRSKSWN